MWEEPPLNGDTAYEPTRGFLLVPIKTLILKESRQALVRFGTGLSDWIVQTGSPTSSPEIGHCATPRKDQKPLARFCLRPPHCRDFPLHPQPIDFGSGSGCPWEKMAPLFWLVDFKGEPFPGKINGHHWATGIWTLKHSPGCSPNALWKRINQRTLPSQPA